MHRSMGMRLAVNAAAAASCGGGISSVECQPPRLLSAGSQRQLYKDAQGGAHLRGGVRRRCAAAWPPRQQVFGLASCVVLWLMQLCCACCMVLLEICLVSILSKLYWTAGATVPRGPTNSSSTGGLPASTPNSIPGAIPVGSASGTSRLLGAGVGLAAAAAAAVLVL